MDFPSTPEEPTSVIRIMDEFDDFLTGGRSRRHVSRTRSGRFSGIDSMGLNLSQKKTSPEFTKEKEIELLTSKAKVAELESQLKTFDTERKRSRIEDERDSVMKERKYVRKAGENQDLHKQLQYLLEKEESAREEISDLKKKLDAIDEKYTREADGWRREKKVYAEKLEETSKSQQRTIAELKARLDMNEIYHYKNRAEHSEKQLELLQSKLTKMTNMSKENVELMTKLIAVEQRCMAAEEALAKQDEAVVVAKAMQGQMTKFKELERQNIKLKEENKLLRDSRENSILLQEKNDSVMDKHRKAMEKLESLGRLEVENEELRKKMARWEVEDTPGGTKKARSPTELTMMISDLQKSQLSMMEKQGDLLASNAIKGTSLQSLTEKYKELNNQFLQIQVKDKQQTEKCNRLQRRLLLVTTERDGIRRILNNYDTEATSNYSPQLLSRVKEAEEQVAACNDIIDKMEVEMDEHQKQLNEYRLKSSKLQFEVEELKSLSGGGDPKEISRLKSQIEELQKANELIQETADNLEARIEQRHLQGDFDPTKIKVVHFAGNPLALSRKMRAKELESLKDENEKLRGKLRKLQHDGVLDEAENSMSIFASRKNEKQVEELKSQLESAELQNKRLIEVFQNKVTTFRESIYQLFGYKHDMIGGDKFQIRSIYAESSEDKFLFQNSPEGQIQMIETDFSLQFPSAISAYLQRGSSIPAFLSSITLELFSKQTQIQDTTLARIAVRS